MRKKKELKSELSRLLSQKASEEEKERLHDMEIDVKNPTRMTVIAASLYKKAAAGELTAIKELLSIIGVTESASGGVTLVDDIGKT